MRSQTAEKLHQIETGLKKAGLQLPAENVEMKLEDRMAHYKVPSVSIVVIDEQEVKLTKTYGALPETVYQAASISKAVSALVALLVAKEKGLDLNEDVNEILKNHGSTYRVPKSAFTDTDEKVTLRRLLSHTAGLTVSGFTGYASDTKELPTTQQILEGEKSTSPTNSKPVESFAVPGTEYRYSGGGTTLVQLILEEVTKEKFPTLARNYVLDPLEMKSSGYEIHRPGEENFHPAIGHDRNGNPVKGDWNLYPESAAAGLWSTPADLARFVIEIQKAYKGESNKIPQDVAQKMLTKQALGEYGLGPEVIEDTVISFSHGGSNKGFSCFFRGFVNGKGAVVMTNSDRGPNLIEEIIPSIAAAYDWPAHYINTKIKRPMAIDATIYEKYANKYQVGGISFEFITENNQFFVIVPFPSDKDKPKKFKLTPDSETSFFHISDEVRLEFVFPSGNADTFTCSLTPGQRGERITKELKVSPSIEPEATQAQLSSTSQVALVMPIDRKIASTDQIVSKISEQSPSSEPPLEAPDKSAVKEAETSTKEALGVRHDK
ncbi:MAG TPA: serine hydrolase domain-containing protein [Candidatus Saccharimonadales bacterium]|nr:serine hydrolase domain-containing protein [Candidatus Saccharimonadales bacterium]